MKILAVDTSTASGSVALVSNDRVQAEWTLTSAQTHNRRLLKSIDRVLAEIGWALEDVDLFAVTVGPGSFTGIRIGLSTMKTMAWALNKPLIGVSTLEALAAPFETGARAVCPMIDARKREVYAALYSPQTEGSRLGLKEKIPPSVLPPEEVASWVKSPVFACGDGWLQYRNLLRERSHGRFVDPGPSWHVIRAGFVAQVALRKFFQKAQWDPFRVLPMYIRPSEAEIHSQRHAKAAT